VSIEFREGVPCEDCELRPATIRCGRCGVMTCASCADLTGCAACGMPWHLKDVEPAESTAGDRVAAISSNEHGNAGPGEGEDIAGSTGFPCYVCQVLDDPEPLLECSRCAAPIHERHGFTCEGCGELYCAGHMEGPTCESCMARMFERLAGRR
jgi:hypothetical protein